MQFKKRKIETYSFLLWNEDILYEIVSFIRYVKDYIHLAQTCRNIYNCLLEKDICLNVVFEYYAFKKLPKVFPSYFYNLKYLHFLNGNLTIEELQKFTKLKSLTLPDEFEITDLFLKEFKNLKCLDISNNNLKENLNLEVLKDNLEELNVNQTDITDEQIKSLQNLTELNISNCQYISGECLLNFTKLKKLKAKSVDITIEHLKNLKNLEYLNLNASYLDKDFDISTLQIFKHLKILKLKEIPICNSQYFEKLNLTHLDLNSAGIDDISQLRLPNSLEILSLNNLLDIVDKQLNNLNNLIYLDISNCNSGQLQCTFLENMKNLEKLIAEFTQISDKELSHCKKLQYLNIYNCEKVTGTSLTNLENLVFLASNELIKEEHLKNLKKLNYLYLNNNQNITDELFLNLLNLEHFDCVKCEKIKGINFKYLEKLKRIDFTEMDVVEENLQDLINLKKLTISCCHNFTGKCLQHLRNLKKFVYQHCERVELFSEDELKDLIKKLEGKSIIELMDDLIA